MFYLLEDNRIIDSEEIKVFTDTYYLDKDVFYLYDRNNDEVIGKIKNQSENVFDLIEVGDLIKINFDTTDPTTIGVTYKESHFSTIAIKYYPETILAIYKPDEKGNYIKAWEKKDE